MPKSVLILSNKSSGSSAVQRLLAQSIALKCLEKTRHFENESLYWTKAAAMLHLPQQEMLDSEVPMPPAAARQDLIQLLEDNLPRYRRVNSHTEGADRAMIFDGWRQLCEYYQPVFLEKSPHHLLQWSSLALIMACMEQLEGQVDFLLIGLVRNPMDSLYSAFRRWRTPPEKLQYEWLDAYSNLRQLVQKLGICTKDNPSGRVVIVRYEDLTTSLDSLAPVFDFCGKALSPQARCLNRKSLLKWQQDPFFGFSLAPEVLSLAQSYGYSSAELTNQPWQFWPLYRDFARGSYQRMRWAKDLYIRLNSVGRSRL